MMQQKDEPLKVSHSFNVQSSTTTPDKDLEATVND